MAIVNETFANRNFAGRSAIGAQFKFGNTGDKGYWYRIVGVVKEIHEVGMEEVPRPAVDLLHGQGNNQLHDPSGRDRGSDCGGPGVDCLDNPWGDVVHR